MPKIANLLFICTCPKCKANKNAKSTNARKKMKRHVNKRLRKGSENKTTAFYWV